MNSEFLEKFESLSSQAQLELVEKQLDYLAPHQLTEIHEYIQPKLQRDFITFLPRRGLEELSRKILSYLDDESLGNASKVCKEWRRIIREGFLWKKMIERKVKTDPLWAGLVRRRGYGEYLFKEPKQNFDCQKYHELYHTIQADIKDLQARWDRGEYITRRILCHSENSRGVYCIQYDDNKIVSGLRDNTIKVWDRENLTCHRTFQGHEGSVLCLQYDDKYIVSGSSDSTVRVWDLNDLNNSHPIKTINHHTEAVLHLKFNKKIMVTCSKDRTIIVWDFRSATDIKVSEILIGHRAAVNVVDFDDKYIVSASGDRSIKVWDTKTHVYLKTLNGHRRGIACLQYRDRLIVSGSSDNSIKIWDIENGTCLRTLEGHEELVRCIRFDNKRIVSGAYDGRIKIWDLKAALQEGSSDTSLFMKELFNHTGRVFRLQFDEFQIVSSSHDDSIIIWDFLNPVPPKLQVLLSSSSTSLPQTAIQTAPTTTIGRENLRIPLIRNMKL